MPSDEDAEDIVHEALTLAVAASDVDVAAAGAWMNRVVRNKAADLARERGYQAHRERYHVRLHSSVVPLDEQICEQDAARSVLRRLRAVPDRQRRALLLAAHGLSGSEIADHMQATPKAVENLLRKGRGALRAGAVVVGALLGGLRMGTHSLRRPAVVGGLVATSLAVWGVADQQSPPALASPHPSVRPVLSGSKPQLPAAAPAQVATRSRSTSPSRRVGPHAVTGMTPASRAVLGAVRVRVGTNEARSPVVTQHGAWLDVLPSVRRCLHDGTVVARDAVGCPPS